MISPSGPCRFTLRGVLDASTAPVLERRLATMPVETSVVLDVSRVTSIDPAGMAAITRIAERLDAVVILEAPTADVARSLQAADPTWRERAVLRPRRAGGPRSAAARHGTRAKTLRPGGPLLDWS